MFSSVGWPWMDALDCDACLAQTLFDCVCAFSRVGRDDVEPVAETLHVGDAAAVSCFLLENLFSAAKILRSDFEPAGVKILTQFGGRTEFADLAEMHQGDAMAAFRFVEIRRGDQDGEAVAGEMRKSVPEFAAGNGIDAGGRLVEEQDLRLRHQRADQREFLFHAAAETSGQTFGEAVHVEHVQILLSAPVDFLRRKRAADRRCSGCSRPR